MWVVFFSRGYAANYASTIYDYFLTKLQASMTYLQTKAWSHLDTEWVDAHDVGQPWLEFHRQRYCLKYDKPNGSGCCSVGVAQWIEQDFTITKVMTTFVITIKTQPKFPELWKS